MQPMLATLVPTLPTGPGWSYEPKWDGFRCVAARDGGDIDMRSRNDRPLARYFPEVVEALLAVGERQFTLDGELMANDFAALMARLHPAKSRVERLRLETPATYVAFDIVSIAGESLLDTPFAERRRRLETLLHGQAAVLVTPCTDDPHAAAAWLHETRPGIDGVIAKHADSGYEPGRRAMQKIKRERTADCVVAGFRAALDRPVVASLLLGLYRGDELVHVGVASSFKEAHRRELFDELAPLAVPLEGHPWEHGMIFGSNVTGRLKGSASRWTPEMPLDWVPVRPERVCEVAYTQLDVDRFRHPARFVRWRPDREPASCTLEQFA